MSNSPNKIIHGQNRPINRLLSTMAQNYHSLPIVIQIHIYLIRLLYLVTPCILCMLVLPLPIAIFYASIVHMSHSFSKMSIIATCIPCL